MVIYEDKFDATRLWWAFTYYGKSDVRILDGGIQAWKTAGFPVEILPTAAGTKNGNFVAAVAHPSLRVDTSDIASLRHHPTAQLWDNRSLKLPFRLAAGEAAQLRQLVDRLVER